MAKFLLQLAGATLLGFAFGYADGKLNITNARTLDFIVLTLATFFSYKGLRKVLRGIDHQITIDGLDKFDSWSFRCPSFNLHVDFVEKTLSLYADHVTYLEYNMGRDDRTGTGKIAEFQSLDLLSFDFVRVDTITTKAYSSDSGMAVINGEIVQIQLPGGRVVDSATGKSQVVFDYNTCLTYAVPHKGFDASIKGESMKLAVCDVNNSDAQRFKDEWSIAKPRIDALKMARLEHLARHVAAAHAG